MSNLTIIVLNVFGFAMWSPAFLHGQISGERKADLPKHTPGPVAMRSTLIAFQAVWTAQMIAQGTGVRFEHKTASTLRITPTVPPSRLCSSGRRLLLRNGLRSAPSRNTALG